MSVLRFYLAVFIVTIATPAAAEWPWGGGYRQGGQGQACCPPPYGAYCPKRHSDQYGRRQPVQDRQDGLARLSTFFGVPTTAVRISEELRFWYLADILAPNGTIMERVLLDKRTGRIRSIR